jgi:LPXTG-site transpeptidase (sortase) family protein
VVAAVVAASSAWSLAGQTIPDTFRSTPPTRAAPPTDTPDAGRGASSATLAPSREQLIPSRLEIPSIGVRAPVVATGVTKNGDAEIPADGDVVGWYEFGVAPGDAKGSTVLIGHRDTDAEGPGALFGLDLVSVGDDIRVSAGRRSFGYRVTEVRSVPKAGLPSSLFGRGDPPQLVVITCGGAYLPDAGGYQENLYVRATPTRK